MAKRGKMEIIYDILKIIKDNRGCIKPTPLLRKSNISSIRFKEYLTYMFSKGFIFEKNNEEKKYICISEKGLRFLEKYNMIIGFIEEFDLWLIFESLFY